MSSSSSVSGSPASGSSGSSFLDAFLAFFALVVFLAFVSFSSTVAFLLVLGDLVALVAAAFRLGAFSTGSAWVPSFGDTQTEWPPTSMVKSDMGRETSVSTLLRAVSPPSSLDERTIVP